MQVLLQVLFIWRIRGTASNFLATKWSNNSFCTSASFNRVTEWRQLDAAIGPLSTWKAYWLIFQGFLVEEQHVNVENIGSVETM